MSMQLIETVTLTSSASSIEFTSIPQDGVDLLLLTSLRSNRTGSSFDGVALQLNSSSSGFSYIRLNGDGIAIASNTSAFTLAPAADVTANTFSNTAHLFSNYAVTQAKSFSADSVFENNATNAYQIIHAGLWSTTDAITSIQLAPNSGTLFEQYSTASLYIIS